MCLHNNGTYIVVLYPAGTIWAVMIPAEIYNYRAGLIWGSRWTSQVHVTGPICNQCHAYYVHYPYACMLNVRGFDSYDSYRAVAKDIAAHLSTFKIIFCEKFAFAISSVSWLCVKCAADARFLNVDWLTDWQIDWSANPVYFDITNML